MNKVLNIISTLFCLLTIILLYMFNMLVNGVRFNGYTVLILLCMLLNPIANLCRNNKKIIINSLYHLIVMLITGYTSYIAINSLIIYKNNFNWKDNADSLNLSVDYFGDKFLYILIAIFLTVLLTFLFKKVKMKTNKDTRSVMMLIILITSLVPFFNNEIEFGMIWPLSEILFLVILFIKTRGINTTNELQKYYIVLVLLSLLSINPVALVLSIYLLIHLDTFGLNI